MYLAKRSLFIVTVVRSPETEVIGLPTGVDLASPGIKPGILISGVKFKETRGD